MARLAAVAGSRLCRTAQQVAGRRDDFLFGSRVSAGIPWASQAAWAQGKAEDYVCCTKAIAQLKRGYAAFVVRFEFGLGACHLGGAAADASANGRVQTTCDYNCSLPRLQSRTYHLGSTACCPTAFDLPFQGSLTRSPSQVRAHLATRQLFFHQLELAASVDSKALGCRVVLAQSWPSNRLCCSGSQSLVPPARTAGSGSCEGNRKVTYSVGLDFVGQPVRGYSITHTI